MCPVETQLRVSRVPVGVFPLLQPVVSVCGCCLRLMGEFPFSRRDPRLWLSYTEDLADVWGEQQPGQLPYISIGVILYSFLGPLAYLSDCSQQVRRGAIGLP